MCRPHQCRLLCAALAAVAIACSSDKGSPHTADGPPQGTLTPDSGEAESAESAAVEVDGTLTPVGALTPLVDLLAHDLSDAHTVSSVSNLLVDSEGIHILDETAGAAVALHADHTSGGVPLDAHTQLLLLDDQLMVWDGTWLQESPLQAAMPLPAEAIAGHGAHLWLRAGGQLYHHTEGTLSTVIIDSGADVRLVAAGPDGRCAVMAPFLMVLDGFGGSIRLIDHQPDRAATSMAYDAEGSLWLSDGTDRVVRRTHAGDWGAVRADDEIVAVYGHPGADDVWFQTAAAALVYHRGGFHTVAVPPGDWKGVDPLGRLLILGPDGLHRVAAERSVAVGGLLPDTVLETPVTLFFAPTGADSLLSVEAWVGTEALAIDEDRWSTTLDPVSLPPGAHTLRLAAVGPEGTTITELPFHTGALPDATWEDDIEPIMQEHCSRCHSDGAAIPLHTADLWRRNIDRILDEVVAQDMPLGGPYLSDEELARVRGWVAGGFQ